MFKFFRTPLAKATWCASSMAALGTLIYFKEMDDECQRKKLEADNPDYNAVYRFKPAPFCGSPGYFELRLEPKVNNKETNHPMNRP